MQNSPANATRVVCLTTNLSGGISILQISGKNSSDALKKIFVPKRAVNLSAMRFQQLCFGFLRDISNEIVDEVIVRRLSRNDPFCLDRDYQICCHGGSVTVHKILAILKKLRVRQLCQEDFLRLLITKKKIPTLTSKIFSAYFKSPSNPLGKLILNTLTGKNLLSGANSNKKHNTFMIKMLCNPPSVVFFGETNAGKSMLMNQLAQENRSIVSELKGTTRDSVEKLVTLHGLPVKLVDTAGVMDNRTPHLTALSLISSKRCLKKADLILLVFDIAKYGSLHNIVRKLPKKNLKKTILVANKIDLNPALRSRLTHTLPIIYVSALTGEGIVSLTEFSVKKLLGPASLPLELFLRSNQC